MNVVFPVKYVLQSVCRAAQTCKSDACSLYVMYAILHVRLLPKYGARRPGDCSFPTKQRETWAHLPCVEKAASTNIHKERTNEHCSQAGKQACNLVACCGRRDSTALALSLAGEERQKITRRLSAKEDGKGDIIVQSNNQHQKQQQQHQLQQPAPMPKKAKILPD